MTIECWVNPDQSNGHDNNDPVIQYLQINII